jgi:RimJ/RimL family protein N-acetyltransferase
LSELATPMQGDGCFALPFTEEHRAALKAACAEDGEIWAIYSASFAPDRFDASLDAWLARPDMVTFVLFEGEELGGMSSYLAIEPERGVLEIGGTYYRPHLRGTGFNRRVKDMMLRRAFDCGFRRRRPQWTQPGGHGQARRHPRRPAPRRPHHLERPCARYRAVLDSDG